MQFFYSLKESDITSLDIFLEKGMPYTEVTRSGNVDYVITQFLSGVSIMTIDGFDECLYRIAERILCVQYQSRGKTGC